MLVFQRNHVKSAASTGSIVHKSHFHHQRTPPALQVKLEQVMGIFEATGAVYGNGKLYKK